MTVLTLSDGTRNVDLFQVQTDSAQKQADVKPTNPVFQDSSETLISSLTQQEQVSLNGRATGLRLARDGSLSRADGGSFSNDPLTALAEWAQDLMSFVSSEQGSNVSLQSVERSRTINGIVSRFQWTKANNARYEIRYDFEFKRGDAILDQKSTSVGTAFPSQTATLGGTDLQYVNQWSESKELDTGTAAIAFADDPEQNTILPNSGAVRTIQLVGEVVDNLNTFDSNILSLLGENQTATYSSAFPGHDLEVAVRSFEPTREAGRTRIGEYSLELIEGITLG